MIYILLMIIAFISVKIFDPLAAKTRVPLVVFLIFLGILFGPFGIYDFFGQLDMYNQNMSELSILSSNAIIILFLVSGLGLNIEAIKKSGKKTIGLSVVPVYIEGLIMGFITYLIFLLLPIPEFKFGLVNFMMVMSVFAMASPAIIIPINLTAKSTGMKQSIFDEMTIASVLDNFTPFPIMLAYLIVGLAIANGNSASFTMLISKLLIATISIVIAYAVGYLVGCISAYISKPLNYHKYIVPIIMIMLSIIVVILIGPIGAMFGIITGFGVGVGFNVKCPPGSEKMQINIKSNELYKYLLMPLVFIYVGTKIRIDMLLNPILILALVVVTVLSVCIKAFISKKYLMKRGSTEDEAKLSGKLFAAKGIILINISLVIGAAYQSAGLDQVIQFMYILAAVATLISVPYSIISSEKLVKQMKEKDENSI